MNKTPDEILEERSYILHHNFKWYSEHDVVDLMNQQWNAALDAALINVGTKWITDSSGDDHEVIDPKSILSLKR